VIGVNYYLGPIRWTLLLPGNFYGSKQLVLWWELPPKVLLALFFLARNTNLRLVLRGLRWLSEAAPQCCRTARNVLDSSEMRKKTQLNISSETGSREDAWAVRLIAPERNKEKMIRVIVIPPVNSRNMERS